MAETQRKGDRASGFSHGLCYYMYVFSGLWLPLEALMGDLDQLIWCPFVNGRLQFSNVAFIADCRMKEKL